MATKQNQVRTNKNTSHDDAYYSTYTTILLIIGKANTSFFVPASNEKYDTSDATKLSRIPGIEHLVATEYTSPHWRM